MVEITPGLTESLRRYAEGEVRRRLRPDPDESTVLDAFVDASGNLRMSWIGSLRAVVGSTSNWYGPYHWSVRETRRKATNG